MSDIWKSVKYLESIPDDSDKSKMMDLKILQLLRYTKH